MSKPCSPERRRHALAAALLAATTVAWGRPPAAPATVEPFDAATWQALSARAERLTAIVFTATYCANCPEAVALLARTVRERGLDAQVLAVVIDGTPGDRALAAHQHYRGADRLYAFSAPAQQVQHAVNPRWRGITPSVVLIRPGAAPRWITGLPDADALARWAR
jgi:hypothetical protein